MEITEEQLRELADRQTLELPNGDTLNLSIEPDHYTTINDFDCYGRLEWSHRKNYMGHSVRPEGFDGTAEKLDYDGGSTLWWQPYAETKADRRQWHTDSNVRRAQRQLVRDIAHFGFLCYRLEVCQGTDAYGRPVVIDFTTMGGIEPLSDFDTGILADMVAELAHDSVTA